MVKALDRVNLLNRDVKLKNMTLLDCTLEIVKMGLQLIGIQDDFRPAIPALDADPMLDLRPAFLILISTILTNEFQFNVHIFSRKNRILTPSQTRVQFSLKKSSPRGRRRR